MQTTYDTQEPRVKTRARIVVREILTCCVLVSLWWIISGMDPFLWKPPLSGAVEVALIGLVGGPFLWLAFRILRFALAPSLRSFRR